jgi:hypothetical protein
MMGDVSTGPELADIARLYADWGFSLVHEGDESVYAADIARGPVQEPVGLERSNASRVGERGQFCTISRRIVGLCNEKSGENEPGIISTPPASFGVSQNGPLFPLAQ